MSRCFPYPPPGYLRNGVRGEAVKESIKLQRDRENTITELDSKKRKDKRERKVNKEEKKKKKKKKKENGEEIKELCYVVDGYNQLMRSPLPKGKEDEAERSGLTEEHDQPVCSQGLCHSPDSSSNKRKGDEDTGYITKTRGNILCIRLPPRRHREPSTSISGESLCSDHGNAKSLPQHNEISSAPGHREYISVNSKTGFGESGSGVIKQTCVTNSEVKENSRQAHARTDYGKLSNEKREQTVESLYKVLIEDWIPPCLEFDQDNFDDQEWLFDLSKLEGHGNKRFKLSYHGESCHVSPSLWPSARTLHEADVYALPYTVPF